MLFIVYIHTRIALLLGDVLDAELVGHSVPRAAQETTTTKKKVNINPRRARAQRSAPVDPRAIILINRQQIPLSLPLPRSFDALFFLPHRFQSPCERERERDILEKQETGQLAD